MRIAPSVRLVLCSRPPPPTPIDSGGHRARVLARRDALVEAHLSLVPPIAQRISLRLPPCFDLSDLIAVGNLGLLHAATRYRPRAHAGTPFSAFARPRIRGEILNSLRRKNWEESTRPSIDDHPASRTDYQENEPRIEASIEIDLDARILEGRIAEAISRLPGRQGDIVRAYYSEAMPSLAVVGSALGLSEWRVIREHADAIAELRRRLRGAA